MALVAKYFGAAYPIPELYKQYFSEIWFWYKKYEFQTTWDEVIQELSYDSKGKKRKLPKNERIREIVEHRIRTKRSGT